MPYQRLSNKHNTNCPDPESIEHAIERQHAYQINRIALLGWKDQIIQVTDHPNLIQVTDIGISGEEVFIEYQLFNGIKLADLLQTANLTLEDKYSISMQLMAAVEHLHSNGFIHRDINLSNIWVSPTRPYVIKLADIELMCKTNRPDLKTTLGTPGYMAPEQRWPTYTDNITNDIYSIGKTIYRIFFDDSDPKIYIYHLLDTYYPQIKDQKFGRVILKCLEQHPERRYVNISELRECFCSAIGKYLELQ